MAVAAADAACPEHRQQIVLAAAIAVMQRLRQQALLFSAAVSGRLQTALNPEQAQVGPQTVGKVYVLSRWPLGVCMLPDSCLYSCL